jgi:MFS family permease
MSPGVEVVAFVASLPQIAADFGSRGTFVAQMIVSMGSLGFVLGAPVSGWILSRAGTRGALILSSIVFGTAGAGGMFLNDPTLIFVSRFLTGLAAVTMNTTCFWGIGAEYQEDRRARVLGLATMMANAVCIVSVLVGGVLANRGGWRLSFVQYPVFGAVTLLLGLIALRQAKPQDNRSTLSHPPFFKRLLPFYLLSALLFLIIYIGPTQFVFVLQDDGITSPTVRSLFIAGYAGIGSLTGLFYGPMQRRLSPQGAFTLGASSMAIALALIGWSTSAAAAAAGAVLIGVYIGITGTYINHVVTERTDIISRGHALGVLTSFCYVGAFVNPLILNPLGREIGFRNVFLAAALVTAVIAIGAGARLRKLGRVCSATGRAVRLRPQNGPNAAIEDTSL